jgi:hypothetical protein
VDDLAIVMRGTAQSEVTCLLTGGGDGGSRAKAALPAPGRADRFGAYPIALLAFP